MYFHTISKRLLQLPQNPNKNAQAFFIEFPLGILTEFSLNSKRIPSEFPKDFQWILTRVPELSRYFQMIQIVYPQYSYNIYTVFPHSFHRFHRFFTGSTGCTLESQDSYFTITTVLTESIRESYNPHWNQKIYTGFTLESQDQY